MIKTLDVEKKMGDWKGTHLGRNASGDGGAEIHHLATVMAAAAAEAAEEVVSFGEWSYSSVLYAILYLFIYGKILI